ncbi:MAG: hypothetical protein COA78_14645 [Blastopirellula sp.]|nr:MAG: hypothetical protein COA78_14645 [Blastopirellula sp.]
MYRFAQRGLFVFVLALTASERQAEGQTSDSTQGTAESRFDVKLLDSPPQTRRETQEELDTRVRELEKQLANLSENEIKAELKLLRKPSSRITGRIMTDWVHYGQDAANKATVGNLMNGAEFRRTRLGIKGRVYETTFYEWELDFSDGEIEYKDLYIGMDGLGISGAVVLGHFKEPFSFDELTSSRYISLLERALPNVFAPSRALGAAYYNVSDDERMTFAIGTFNTTLVEETGGFQNDNGGQDVTTRLTWLPYYDEPSEGRYLVHLGANYSFRKIADDMVQYKQRPEAHLSSLRFVDTGVIPASQVQLFSAEMAWVSGPLSLQSEYIASFVDRNNASGVAFHGAYVLVSYFLTGENRVYDREAAEFDRVKPYNSFVDFTDDGELCRGYGAWEVAARWSYLDLDDKNIAGGTLQDFTIGLNWHLTPYTRIMCNYVRANLDRNMLKSHANIFAIRAQIDF